MIKVICIGGQPCCGKTTLCNSIAHENNAISLDLEAMRSTFFEENISKNVLKFTKNEPIKSGEDLRTYFLRCVIYDRILNINEYVEWYKYIMKNLNIRINEMLKDFNIMNYKKFKNKYNSLIEYCPQNKPKLIVMNHALLPLTDIWKKSELSIMLTGKESILLERFFQREQVDTKYKNDVLRHMSLYKILNNQVKASISYDTTNKFMSTNQINDIIREILK